MSPRRRREQDDELGRALRYARNLWDAFLGACTVRDRCYLAGNVAGARAATITITSLDEMLTAAEAAVQRIDEADARERGPRLRARSPRVHHIAQPLGVGMKMPRPALEAERG